MRDTLALVPGTLLVIKIPMWVRAPPHFGGRVLPEGSLLMVTEATGSDSFVTALTGGGIVRVDVWSGMVLEQVAAI